MVGSAATSGPRTVAMIGIVVRVRGVVGSAVMTAVTIGGMSVGIVRVGSAVMTSAVSAVGS
ncbi:hypothetical protein ACSNOF_27405, partial [Streptomyces sp. URMC 125]